VVDKDDVHAYRPGLLFVPFGLACPQEIVRSRHKQLRRGIVFHQAEVEAVDLERDRVRLAHGRVLPYDVLVVATGAVLQPAQRASLALAGWSGCSPSIPCVLFLAPASPPPAHPGYQRSQ